MQIPPKNIGGIAGGLKYISQGILFKFAIDPKRILYSEDEFCMKTANAELRGLTGIISCNVSEIFFPLMALIDYRGFRIVATSLLPVGRDTIWWVFFGFFFLDSFVK